MTRKHSLPLLLVLSCVTGVYAQPWAGIISPDRAIDWSRVGIAGGIPNRTQICATLNPGVSASQINSAIASCPSGQVVFLNAGTYKISGIDFGGGKSDVTLRGAGADQTKLVFNSSSSVSCNGWFPDVCIHSSDTNYRGGPSHSANWTAGYAKGTTVITLSSTSGLSVGDPIMLDQLNDDTTGTTDTGGIYVCTSVAAQCNDDGPTGGPGGAARDGRDQIQVVTATAISGNQVTITPGLYMPNWRSSQSPGAWWADKPAFNVGIEDLSLDHTNADDKAGIVIFNCGTCWVKGIRSINSNRSHVWVQYSRPVVVRDSYFYGTANAASQSYGVEIFPGSDVLMENNIFQHITAPQMIGGACSGCVVSYNYSTDDYYTVSPGYQMQSVWLHSGGIDNVLLEGNVGVGMYSDVFHGSHHFITAFRNRYNGTEPGKNNNQHPMNLWPRSRFYNIVGNVLGESGVQNNYQATPTSSSGIEIFVLGSGTVNCCSQGDQATVTTLMRWGNYDTVTGSARFLSTEIPVSLSKFANPIPQTQTLPASLYLSGKPAWFGSVAWPPAGPDVTGGNIANVAGHANKIPAQLCFENAAKDSGNIIVFNAAKCYGQQTTTTLPNPPTGLTAVVN
jgi:hypothetical protein